MIGARIELGIVTIGKEKGETKKKGESKGSGFFGSNRCLFILIGFRLMTLMRKPKVHGGPARIL